MTPVQNAGAVASNQNPPEMRVVQSARAVPPHVHEEPAHARPPNLKGNKKSEAGVARIAKLESLLMLEADARSAQTLRELIFCIANETRKCVPARQTYVLRTKGKSANALKIDAVSNLSSVDRNAPAVRWLEQVFARALDGALSRGLEDRAAPIPFEIPSPEANNAGMFPFRYGVLVPLTDTKEQVFAAIALVSEVSFKESDALIVRRLRDVYRHSWLALAPRPHNRLSWFFRKRTALAATLLAIIALFIPVPLTTLAPVEVVAMQPHVVAAPIDGVVERMLVDPNVMVVKGQELFTYVDTDLAARRAIAEQNRNVARAKLQTAQQNSFGSSNGRRDLAVAKAELDLAEAELAHADSQLAKTRVSSPRDGLVVFDRKTDWQGKPVTTGERVIEIADPAMIEYRVDLAVSDAIVLEQGARTKIFLDSNPLSPREANVASANYRASMSAADQLVYKVYAAADGSDDELPRIGARGTAQIYGERVSLGFYLFRRPLSAARQWLGW